MSPDQTSIWIQIAKEFGFPVVVCVCLAIYIWVRQRQSDAALERNTRAAALVVLAMSFAPKQFRLTAEELYEESLRASQKRGDELEPDHRPKHE